MMNKLHKLSGNYIIKDNVSKGFQEQLDKFLFYKTFSVYGDNFTRDIVNTAILATLEPYLHYIILVLPQMHLKYQNNTF